MRRYILPHKSYDRNHSGITSKIHVLIMKDSFFTMAPGLTFFYIIDIPLHINPRRTYGTS